MTPAEEERAAVVAFIERHVRRLQRSRNRTMTAAQKRYWDKLNAEFELKWVRLAIKRGDHRAPATGKETK